MKGVVLLMSLNAFLVILTPLIQWKEAENTIQAQSADHDIGILKNRHLCCMCNTSSELRRKTINYSVIATATPSISGKYRIETLTRLGTDLKFDVHKHCPTKAVMQQSQPRQRIPLHNDCPNLFIIGARKAGTTSLYHYLSNHPHFEGTRLDFGPKSGETFYFTSYYEKEAWSNYLKRFPSGGMMTGDASVGNLVHCKAPRRIFKACGKQAKVVILLRHPVNRFVSNFLMRAKLGIARVRNTTSLSVFVRNHIATFYEAAMKKRIDVIDMPRHWQQLHCLFKPAINLAYEGLYYTHIMNWLCNFPAENIMIINSEEFYNNTSVIFNQVLQFLGLEVLESDVLSWITTTVYNKSKYKVPKHQMLSLKQRKELNWLYRPFNKALFELLDWREVDWN